MNCCVFLCFEISFDCVILKTHKSMLHYLGSISIFHTDAVQHLYPAYQ